jgi:hypothetical protein
MSLSGTKMQLIQLLSDTDNKVIALSGKWGTGKSHLWRDVKAETEDDKVKAALYVSLFGLASMDQIKLKIVQSAIPVANEQSSRWDNAVQACKAAAKVAESFNKGFSALNDIVLLAVPSILKDRVIVLDDIERKHEKLSVDEVMGFIDEFTQQHGARFILILNNDQLKDLVLWDTLREKVIDHELRLNTTPAEAFEIATSLVSSSYVAQIGKAVETSGITNIRIICKIIRVVNRILGKRTNLSDDVLARVIPSTVLLSAIYYKGLDDGPDLDFVLKVGDPRSGNELGKKSDESDAAAGKLRAKWRLQLHGLGIISCDEYEQIIVDYLRSGLFDDEGVTKIIERYASDENAVIAENLARQLIDHVVWHWNMTESELVEEAKGLLPKIHLLNAYNVTFLHQLISPLAGSLSVAEDMLNNWINEFRMRNPQGRDFDNSFQLQPLHPLIQAEFDTAKAKTQANTSILDACKYIAKHNAWGQTQVMALGSASIRDFEVTIKSLDIDDLRFFMCHFLEMCGQQASYRQHFGTATDNFIAACRNIYEAKSPGRLSGLIHKLFYDAKLEDMLSPSPAKA